MKIREYSVAFNYCYTTVDTETGKKSDFYLANSLIYALPSLQKKCINILDEEMISHNVELHFELFFLCMNLHFLN